MPICQQIRSVTIGGGKLKKEPFARHESEGEGADASYGKKTHSDPPERMAVRS